MILKYDVTHNYIKYFMEKNTFFLNPQIERERKQLMREI